MKYEYFIAVQSMVQSIIAFIQQRPLFKSHYLDWNIWNEAFWNHIETQLVLKVYYAFRWYFWAGPWSISVCHWWTLICIAFELMTVSDSIPNFSHCKRTPQFVENVERQSLIKCLGENLLRAWLQVEIETRKVIKVAYKYYKTKIAIEQRKMKSAKQNTYNIRTECLLYLIGN